MTSCYISGMPVTAIDLRSASEKNKLSTCGLDIESPKDNMYELMATARDSDSAKSDDRCFVKRFGGNMSFKCDLKEKTGPAASFPANGQNSNAKIVSSSILPKDISLPCSSLNDYPNSQLYVKADTLNMSRKPHFDHMRNVEEGKARYTNFSKNPMPNDGVQMKDFYNKPLYRRFKQKNNYRNDYHNNGFMPLPPRLYGNKQFCANYFHPAGKDTRNTRYYNDRRYNNKFDFKNGFHSARPTTEMGNQSLEAMRKTEKVSSDRNSTSPGSVCDEVDPKCELRSELGCSPSGEINYSSNHLNSKQVPAVSAKGSQSDVHIVSLSCVDNQLLSSVDSMQNRLSETPQVSRNCSSPYKTENENLKLFNKIDGCNASSLVCRDSISAEGSSPVNLQNLSENVLTNMHKNAFGGNENAVCITGEHSSAKIIGTEQVVPRNEAVAVPNIGHPLSAGLEQPINQDFKTPASVEMPANMVGPDLSSCEGIHLTDLGSQSFCSYQRIESSSKSKVSNQTVSGSSICSEELNVCDSKRLVNIHQNVDDNIINQGLSGGIADNEAHADCCESVNELHLTDSGSECVCRASSSLSSSSSLSKINSSCTDSLTDIPPPVMIADGCVCFGKPSDISFGIDYKEILEICSSATTNCAFCSKNESSPSLVLSFDGNPDYHVNSQLISSSEMDSIESDSVDVADKFTVSKYVNVGNKKLLWKGEDVNLSKCNISEIYGFLQKAWSSGDI